MVNGDSKTIFGGFYLQDRCNSSLSVSDSLPLIQLKCSLISFCSLTSTILGDPGATSRDDVIFSGERHFWRESLFQGLKSPWALFLTKRVPEVSKSAPLIGQKKYFSGQSTRRSSRVILSPFYFF